MFHRPARLLLPLATLVAAWAPLSAASAQPGMAPILLASDLSPGESRWQPEAAPTGNVQVVVSVLRQVAYVYRGGTLIGVSTVSTGKPGYDTPLGVFPILQKEVNHRSNLYDAEMPYMQRLTWDGVALHAGNIPGKPASHGCVRLPKAFARQLFDVTRLGATVYITEDETTPPSADWTPAQNTTAMADPYAPTLTYAPSLDRGTR